MRSAFTRFTLGLRISLGAVLAASVLLASPAFAQDTDAAAGREPDDSAQTDVAPQNYPLDRLEAEVAPLRRDNLSELAEMWLGHLQQAVDAEAALILGGSASGDALAKAESRREAVADRLDVVLDSLEAKGGDSEEYRDYMSAVGGSRIDWFNPQAVVDYFVEWATSPDGGIRLVLNVVKFVSILVIAWLLARIFAGVARSAVKRLPKSSTLLQEFVVTMTRRIVLIIGIVVALGALGLNIGPLVAAIGAAGLVIGLALQGTLSNFASGILILVYRPFDVGDAVKVGGVSGKVEAMNLVQTTILTWDNQIQFVPNNEIWDSVITNINGRDIRRVDMVFGIGYGDDMAKAESIIAQVIEQHEQILAEPAPTIKVHELADSSVNFVVRPWVKNADYWGVWWDLTRKIKERFDAEGVGIPFPQRDIHLPEELRVVVRND